MTKETCALRTLRWGDCPGLFGCLTGVLIGRQESESQRRQDDEGSRGQREKGEDRFEDAMPLALKTEEGARSQGMWVESRSQKRQGNGFSPRAPRGMEPC